MSCPTARRRVAVVLDVVLAQDRAHLPLVGLGEPERVTQLLESFNPEDNPIAFTDNACAASSAGTISLVVGENARMGAGEREGVKAGVGPATGRRGLLATPLPEDSRELRGWLVSLRQADWRAVDPGLLALAGLALVGQLAYPAGWVIAGSLQRGYSIVNNYVSDLGARTAKDPWIMNTGLILFGTSFLPLAIALRRSLPNSRASTLAPWWFVAIAIAFIATGFLHEECWATTNGACHAQQQAGALSWQHYAHGSISFVEGLLLDLSPLVILLALPVGLLRKACGTCAVVGVLGAIGLVTSTAVGVGYRDGQGVVERVYVGIINGWVLVLFAAMLLAKLIAATDNPQASA
jgi:hypothetical protein